MMLLVLLGLIVSIGWLNKRERIGSLSDATKGAGVSEG